MSIISLYQILLITFGTVIFSSSVFAQNKVVVVPLAGNDEIEVQHISVNYQLNSFSNSCHAHGGLPCYYGSGTATCPAGMVVLGGGVAGSSGRFGSLSSSYPASATKWLCNSSYDIFANRVCFAICAKGKEIFP